MKNKWVPYGMALGLALSASATSARAQFTETEPNDNKAGANGVSCLSPGSTITGNTTGASTTVAGPASSDNFLVQSCALPLGIYRHRLTITTTGTAGHIGSIRGLSQIAAPADTLAGIPWDGVVGTPGTTDTAVQTGSSATTPARFNQWYGFGKAEQLYYRVTGTASTTADYVATYDTVAVTPTSIGSYQPGNITIETLSPAHTTDTDFWVYDGNLNAIPGFGNDDESTLGGSPGDPPSAPGATLRSWMVRNFAPGTYYLAMSNFSTANNQPAASDDDFRTGTLMDFADVIANSSTSTTAAVDFVITDSAGNTLAVPSVHAGAFDINWFTFTVVPEPASLTLLAMGGLALLRRRRA